MSQSRLGGAGGDYRKPEIQLIKSKLFTTKKHVIWKDNVYVGSTLVRAHIFPFSGDRTTSVFDRSVFDC